MNARVSRTGLIVGAWLVSLGAIVLFVHGDAHAFNDTVAQARALGLLSFGLLSVTLCVSPFARWLRESAKLRRTLGLIAASSALLHAEVGLWSSPLSVPNQLADPQLRFGLGALLVLLVLALTSFPGVVSAFRLRSWKELHRLAYVAWICALLHGLLAPYAWLRALCLIAACVLVVGLLRFVPARARAQPDDVAPARDGQ